MSRPALPDSDSSALLLLTLERQARRSPVHSLRLNGREERTLGLLLVRNGAPGAEVAAALSELRLENRRFQMSEEELARRRGWGQGGGQARDACQVTVEERAQLFGFLHKDAQP
jgi:hypothetical protein